MSALSAAFEHFSLEWKADYSWIDWMFFKLINQLRTSTSNLRYQKFTLHWAKKKAEIRHEGWF